MNKFKLLKPSLYFLLTAIIAVYFTLKPFRVDFTEDKRYSLADYTKDLMREVDEPILMTLYLDGDLNPSFYKLRKATLDLIDDLSSYTSKKIFISTINPSEAGSEELRMQNYQKLVDKGLIPTDVYMRDQAGNSIRTTLFPWLEIAYKGQKVHIALLKNLQNYSGEENINLSIENLEFEIASAITRLSIKDVTRIAFLEGHGELGEAETYQITQSLSRYYQIDRGVLGDDASALIDYEVVIVAGPQEPFSEAEKYILDQYIMYGGKLIWLIDGVRVDRKQLATQAHSPAIPLNLNLEDMFYKYGVRIQPVLIQDLQCSYLPVNIAPKNEAPQFDLMPWHFSPLLLSAQHHPITNHIGEIKSEFVSSIELSTKATQSSYAAALLASSSQSRIIHTPTILSLENMQEEDEVSFNLGYLPVAVLIEGQFSSNYLNRMQPQNLLYTAPFKGESYPTQQLFIASSSIIRNETNGIASDTTTLPLGYDRVMDVSFGNENFFVNAVNYMAGNAELIDLRTKEYTIRLLNKYVSQEKRTILQIVNIVLPLCILLFCALAIYWVRRLRYSK